MSVLPVLGIDGDTHTGRNIQLLSCDLKMLIERQAYLLRHDRRILLTLDDRQQHHKVIAADTRHRVGFPQHLVAHSVSQVIVDGLEFIKVDTSARDQFCRAWLARALRERSKSNTRLGQSVSASYCA